MKQKNQRQVGIQYYQETRNKFKEDKIELPERKTRILKIKNLKHQKRRWSQEENKERYVLLYYSKFSEKDKITENIKERLREDRGEK